MRDLANKTTQAVTTILFKINHDTLVIYEPALQLALVRHDDFVIEPIWIFARVHHVFFTAEYYRADARQSQAQLLQFQLVSFLGTRQNSVVFEVWAL